MTIKILVCIKAVLFAILIQLTTTFGAIFVGGCCAPIFFVHPKAHRFIFDHFMACWECFVVAMLELMLGIRIVVSGDRIRTGEGGLLLMNHRTRLDWMYLWCLLVRQSGVRTMKIILKDMLKYVPGGGWAMQVGAFIFIKRRWEQDKKILGKMVDYYADLSYNAQILLFPEGTDFTKATKGRSDQFAEKNGLPFYDYVLHPRTTGFTFLAQRMRQNGSLQAIYDISVAYPYNIAHSEPEFASGNVPREIHFHVKRHPVDSLPTEDSELATWCNERWAEKEDLLRTYYTEKKSFLPLADTLANGDLEGAGEGSLVLNSSTSSIERSADEVRAQWIMWGAVIYWTVFTVAIALLLYYNWLMRLFFLSQCIFFFAMGRYGGFDIFQVDYFNRFFNSRRNHVD